MAEIKNLMVTELISVEPSTSAKEAARRMVENRVGAVLVVNDTGLCGILSERDLVTRVVAAGEDLDGKLVGDIATTDVVTVDVSSPFRTVLETFRKSRFRHLPVMDGARPVGILSTRDFLAFLVDGLEGLIDDASYREQLARGIDPYDHLGGSYDK